MNNKKGFTLVEIIVSVCLLAVLMALTVPGLMNYFDDVDQDKYVAETRSVVAQMKSSYSQLSLSGSYGSNTLPANFKEDILKAANGNGEIDEVLFDNGKLTYLSYKIGGKLVTYDDTKGEDQYFVLEDTGND